MSLKMILTPVIQWVNKLKSDLTSIKRTYFAEAMSSFLHNDSSMSI